MKDVQCYELFGGIALKNHAFSFSNKFIAKMTRVQSYPTVKLHIVCRAIFGAHLQVCPKASKSLIQHYSTPVSINTHSLP